jgi:ATP-dependent DNA ligase
MCLRSDRARRQRFASKAARTALRDGIIFNQHYYGDGAIIFKQACTLGCEGIVSKRLGYPYRSGRVNHWLKIKNPAAPAVKREAEEDWASRDSSFAAERLRVSL